MNNKFIQDLKTLAKNIEKLEGKTQNVVDGQFVEDFHLNKVKSIPLAKDEKGAAINAAFHASITGQKIDKDILDKVEDEEIINEYIKKLLDNVLRK